MTSTKTRSNVSVVCVLVLAVAGTLPACSDNTVVDMPDTGPLIDTGPRPDGALPDGGPHDTGVHDGGAVDANLPDTNVDAFVAPDAFVDVDGGSDAGPPPCGNGVVDTGETCDTAIASGTGACPTSCDDSVACTTDAMTGSACTLACTHTPITTPSGTTADMCCPTGATHATDTDCPASCGNGVVDSGETCDTAITTGTGVCPTAASCNDAMACTTDALVSGGTCNAMCTHTPITAPSGTTVDMCCPPAANHNTDTDCAAVCGNSVIEGPGETCDPPAAGTCDASCHTIAGCGDGVLQTGEDCDDHNHLNLDGCSSTCHYEAFARLTTLQISGNTAPAACAHTRNQLGAHALSNTALGQLNPTLNTDVSNGTLNVLLQALGLTDLTGATDPTFNLGVTSGVPDPAAGAWPMAGNPIDWRFFVDHSSLDAMGVPTAQLPASIAGHALTSGPASVTIPVVLAGTTANLVLFNTHAFGTVSTTASHPTYPAGLRTGLTAFDSVDGTGANHGLCGDISVGSLAQIPLPQSLAMGGGTACNEGYTYCGMGNPVSAGCNSLLDALVGGCRVTVAIFTVTAINPTQPDVAAPGGGAVVNLTVGAGRHVTNVAANTNEAYSGFFTFTANRAHASGELCTAAAQCQTGQTMCSMTGTSGTGNLICH